MPCRLRRRGRRAVRGVGRAGRGAAAGRGPGAGRGDRVWRCRRRALQPWARWVTPEVEPRRYDTFFFVAGLDAVAAAGRGDRRGLARGLDPDRQALAEYRQGERPMLPPTVRNLMDVAAFGSVDEVLAAAPTRPIRPIMPVLRELADGSRVADLGDGSVLPLPAGFITASGKRLP